MKKKLTLEEIKLEEMLSKIERDLTEKKRAPNFRKKYKQHSGIKKQSAPLVPTVPKTIIYHIWRAYVDNLTNIEYKYLDIVLSKYKYLPSRIARRKLEIETFHTTDANIGGGKSNIVTKRTEWLIERFDSDVKLKGLECQQRAVEATIELLDDTMKRVFELRWIDGYTPQEIAELTNSSVKNTQKRLERIMEIFADYWGWT